MPRRGHERWPLVGRDEELAAFGRAWADRGCRGVVICGPAGVGKTRLGESCLVQAMHRGSTSAMRATASAAARAVPLGAIAHLIPPNIDMSNPAQGYAAVVSKLASSHGSHRVVLIDDLHHLDAASAVLLRQLIDASGIRLITTIRTGEPVNDAVAALTRNDKINRIDLAPFDQKRVESLLQAVLAGPISRRTAHALYQASGGNALYLYELVHGALSAKTLTSDGRIWELTDEALPSTPRLTELIGARLSTVASSAYPVLELLALCEPVPVDDLCSAASMDSVLALEEAQLIQIHQDRRRNFVTLAHPLYGEVLRAGIRTLRRRTLLLDQAARVQSHGARRRDDPLRVATWYLTAVGTADSALLIQAAALARHGHDYRQAITLLRSLPAHQHTFSSRLVLGDALFHAGETEEAAAVLASADAATATEQQKLAVTIARIMALFWGMARTAEALEVNNSAKEYVSSPASRRTLRINEGAMRTMSGEPTRGLAMLENLEQDVSHVANVSSWLLGAMTKTMGLAQVGRTAEAVLWADHAYTNHLSVDDQALYGHPAVQLHYKCVALAENGQLAQASAVGQRALDDLVTANVSMSQVRTALFLARTEWLAGHPQSARRWYAQSISVAVEQNQFREMRLALAGLAASAALVGDLDAAKDALHDLEFYLAPGYLAGEDRLGEAWCNAARGHLSQARSVLTEAANFARRTGHITSEALLLTDVARLGGAENVVNRLTELANVSDGTFAAARAHMAVALVARDPGKLSASALEFEMIGADLLAAEASAQAAAAYQGLADRRRATAAADQSAEFATRCEGARTPLLTSHEAAATLTEREREIALLAAAGEPSKIIAETLNLSVRTVDNHLQHAYTKLGVTTRSELATSLGEAIHHGASSKVASRDAVSVVTNETRTQ
ncbi:LuxR C-terminal-related transcriptional regulator [Streptomyces collinus]|uniref:helix-turn-helix transcriptional regulator n=1 Tax=Streptomyces collinus TaxID=42684 RepID=UPI0036BB56F4